MPNVSRCLAAAALVAMSCGELADKHSKPPVLASIHGSITLADAVTPPQGALRLALIWYLAEVDTESAGAQCTGADENNPYLRPTLVSARQDRLLFGYVQQNVEVTPEFPSAFTLQIDEPPPAAAMVTREDGARKAEARLIVYRDGNGNGQLDPRTADAASPDQVLNFNGWLALSSKNRTTQKTAWDYEVIYLDRDVPPSDDGLIDLKAGYNVLAYGNYGPVGVRVADELTLELLPTPALQGVLCPGACEIVDGTPFTCPADPSTELPARPANAIQGYNGSAEGWVWQDGADSVIFERRSCARLRQPDGTDSYTFYWLRESTTGCGYRKVQDCAYPARDAAPVSTPDPKWPCSEYPLLVNPADNTIGLDDAGVPY